MAISTPTNPDLPSSVVLPGVYFKLNLSAGGAGLSNPKKTLLLIGCKTSGGTAPVDTLQRTLKQADADTYFGQGSDLARQFGAAVDEVGPGVIDIMCLPISEPSSGTAATHLITLAGTASASGSITVSICGYPCSVAVANGDTASSIASSLSTQINLLKNIPVTSSPSSGTITLTYRHKGLQGNDLPRIVTQQGATGITASAGTVTFTGSAGSTGAITVSVGSSTVSYTVTNGDANTATATGLAAAINASGVFPCTASASSGVVTLLYAPDRVVHRITASMGTVTAQTVAVAAGTAGAGAPTLTTALSNLASQREIPVWSSAFNDGGSGSTFHGGSGASSSVGAIKTHIATYADGYNQKGQRMFFGATESLATSGGYQTSTGVQTVSDDGQARFVEIFCPDSPQQAYELAARAAAEHVAKDYLPYNYAGLQLKSHGRVPLLMPHQSVRLGPADSNSAIFSYYMTPLAVDDSAGAYYIVRDRTTCPSEDARLWSWGTIATLDYVRSDMSAFLSETFKGKTFKKVSPPRTPNVVTENSIKEAAAARLRSYDSIDFVDDIDSLVKGLTAQQDAIVKNRVNIFLPIEVPIPLYQQAGNINLV